MLYFGWMEHVSKQPVAAWSSSGAEYHVMAHWASELLWFTLRIRICNKQPYGYILCNNSIYPERSKHIEADCHFIQEMWKIRKYGWSIFESKIKSRIFMSRGFQRSNSLNIPIRAYY